MLSFIDICYKIPRNIKSDYKFIYDNEGLPYLINGRNEWQVNYVIHGVPYNCGAYMEDKGVYYLMYEETRFYK